MTTQQIGYFLKLAEELNYTNVARMFFITQPTLSHHMKILCDSGIVSGRKEGKWMYYSISDEGLKKAQAYLDYLKTKGAGE